MRSKDAGTGETRKAGQGRMRSKDAGAGETRKAGQVI